MISQMRWSLVGDGWLTLEWTDKISVEDLDLAKEAVDLQFRGIRRAALARERDSAGAVEYASWFARPPDSGAAIKDGREG